MDIDFIVIGSGLAGLTSALTLAHLGEVLLLSKKQLSQGSTELAQGGISAVVDGKDSFTSHIMDTLVAGAHHNSKKAVKYIVEKAPSAIHWLEQQGVVFDKTGGDYALGREGGHNIARILHVTDFTGQAIERVLLKRIKEFDRIHTWEGTYALDLLVKDNHCYGVQVIRNNKIINCYSSATILATGGLGQVYHWTTNPKVSTGDGIAMAARAGAKISDLEFIQFHPTALKHGNSPLFLLSEAIRGEGAYLINEKKERFMQRIDRRAELAPRDIVARTIFTESQKGNVFLDCRHLGKSFLQKRFPNIYNGLKDKGFDMSKDLLPVAPVAHYSCGGITVDLDGRTSVAKLFAFGEVACTGVHGANRLASNSLLEAVVFPRRLEKYTFKPPVKLKKISGTSLRIDTLHIPFRSSTTSSLIKKRLQRLMWEEVGIVRTIHGLKKALNQIEEWEREISNKNKIDKKAVELKNMLLVSRLIIKLALHRPLSLGAHYISA